MKIKLPKRFYTLEQLSEHWECKIDDINHIIDTGDLKTTPYLAALHGKENIEVQVTSDLDKYVKKFNEAQSGKDYVVLKHFTKGETKEEFIQEFLNELRENGPINITAEELRAEIPDDEFDGQPQSLADLADETFRELHEDGSYDPVVTAAEVSRFEREFGEATKETAPLSSWPWGDYDTPLLRILEEAVKNFCLGGPEHYPKKESGEIVNWIKSLMESNGMQSSENLAGVMETLIAPRPYAHHRQRKKRKPGPF